MTISLGLLSWHAHETLVKTLSSYAHLRDMVDEKVMFFNDISDEDRRIAADFGFRAAGTQENLGILGGTLNLARELSGDAILLVQNDNPVNVPPEVLKSRLDDAIALLESGEADMVRLRDRFDPTFSDESKYLRYWPGEGEKDCVARILRRLARPAKARRMAGRAPAVVKRPDLVHPGLFSLQRGCFMADSEIVNYSDQPYVARRPLVMELLEYADAHKEGTRTLNGRYVPEIVINGDSWRRRHLKIAISEGVFAHARYDDSFRPGNKGYNPALSR